jgi:hypothetical protein
LRYVASSSAHWTAQEVSLSIRGSAWGNFRGR